MGLCVDKILIGFQIRLPTTTTKCLWQQLKTHRCLICSIDPDLIIPEPEDIDILAGLSGLSNGTTMMGTVFKSFIILQVLKVGYSGVLAESGEAEKCVGEEVTTKIEDLVDGALNGVKCLLLKAVGAAIGYLLQAIEETEVIVEFGVTQFEVSLRQIIEKLKDDIEEALTKLAEEADKLTTTDAVWKYRFALDATLDTRIRWLMYHAQFLGSYFRSIRACLDAGPASGRLLDFFFCITYVIRWVATKTVINPLCGFCIENTLPVTVLFRSQQYADLKVQWLGRTTRVKEIFRGVLMGGFLTHTEFQKRFEEKTLVYFWLQ
ncbi:hypothetical protein T265_11757 [Opisthorchis viverrini]|uniref:Uncharacterized protein n=1 Tax=Opisthorchis viverrini TaxID=6198 RepID=A0A074YXT6_OPIVI|nr:hypothetical protein T265_11757 [Opisthorchis viverrini]KER19483.1 hypothetical protein T265_11757 [Opisthorchis viverrini]